MKFCVEFLGFPCRFHFHDFIFRFVSFNKSSRQIFLLGQKPYFQVLAAVGFREGRFWLGKRSIWPPKEIMVEF